jgi:hypothetical protein
METMDSGFHRRDDFLRNHHKWFFRVQFIKGGEINQDKDKGPLLFALCRFPFRSRALRLTVLDSGDFFLTWKG